MNQQELESLNEYELNKLVAKRICPDLEIAFPGDFPESSKVRFISKVDFDAPDVDYCNNISDTWPIIIENGISLIKLKKVEDYFAAEDIVQGNGLAIGATYHTSNKNPLRAAMIVFLLMKGETQCS